VPNDSTHTSVASGASPHTNAARVEVWARKFPLSDQTLDQTNRLLPQFCCWHGNGKRLSPPAGARTCDRPATDGRIVRDQSNNAIAHQTLRPTVRVSKTFPAAVHCRPRKGRERRTWAPMN